MNDSYYICETCGSDDIKRYGGNVCYCYDCDSVSTCYEIEEKGIQNEISTVD